MRADSLRGRMCSRQCVYDSGLPAFLPPLQDTKPGQEPAGTLVFMGSQ